MCFHLNVKDKGQKMENAFLSSSYILLISGQFNCILLIHKHFTDDPVYKIKVNLIGKREYGQSHQWKHRYF